MTSINIHAVVYPPVYFSHPPSGVEQALKDVEHEVVGTDGYHDAVDGVKARVDDVGGLLEDVGPDEVQQVDAALFAAEAGDSEGEVPDGGAGGLPVDVVPVHQGVLEEGCDGEDVVLAHFSDVLAHEAHRLQHSVLDVELGDPVLIHDGGQDGEGPAALRDDSDGDRRADSVLPVLDLQVVDESVQNILGSDGLGDVPEGADARPLNTLLRRLEHFEQLEADAHPLLGVDHLGAAVGNAPDEVDTVLLDLLVPVLQNGSEAGQQILNGRGHLGHSDDVHDALQSAQNAAQNFGVLLAQILVQHDAQVAHQLVLPARLHDHGNLADEVGGLHPHGGGLVVEAPLDSSRDLLQVHLAPHAERVHDDSEAVEHDGVLLGGVVDPLLLERVEDSVNEPLLEPLVDLARAQVSQDLRYYLHDHPPVGLALVLQILNDLVDNVDGPDLVAELLGRLDYLLVVPPVEGHPSDPEVLEKVRKDLLPHVRRRDSGGRNALLDHLEHDLLHLLVGGLELADQDRHHLAGVVVRVVVLHEGDDVADGLEEGGEALAPVLLDPLPQRPQHAVERLDSVRVGGLREGGEGQGANSADLLLLVGQALRDDVHHLLQVGQDAAPHEDGDLLNDLDAGVPRLPALLAPADSLEEGEQALDAERRGDDREGPRSGVPDVLV
mmetsp:Transcript_11357/g.20623  ORF Transcript_11357/g.20623 Transcript_11357/m.20623 type:complete len:664 (+) Transcript_11357:201-2192(+)